MRIAILHSRYRSGSTSGENRVVEDEATLLRQAGHEVRVWSPTPQASGAVTLMQAGGRAIWSHNAQTVMDAMINEFRPEIIHCHNLFPELSPVVFRVADRRGIPSVMTLHNYRLLCLPATFLRDGRVCEDCLGRIPWRGVVHRCYRNSVAGSASLGASLSLHRMIRSFHKVRFFLAASQFVADKHIEAGFPAGKFRTKPNFAWPSPMRDGAGDYFLYLGRLSAEKGVSVLLEAWRQIRAKLVIVGSGPEQDQLSALTPHNVEFRGDVDPGVVPGLLRRARALLLPSICYEAAPRVIIEAYAAGVPVVGSRIGALVEAIQDNVSGVLVTPDNPRALANGVARLLDDTESKRLGDGAYEAWCERYAPEHAIVALESIYQDAT